MIGLNTFLLLSNGALAILGALLVYAMLEYLWRESALRGISARRWFVGLPVSMQLGVGIAVLALGIVTSGAPIWVWREIFDGHFESWPPLEPWVAVGRLEMAIGIMCLIRVVSRPRHGHRLWLAGLMLVVGFIVITTVTH